MAEDSIDGLVRAVQGAFAEGPAGLRRLLELLAGAAMAEEVTAHLGAGPHERSDARRASAPQKTAHVMFREGFSSSSRSTVPPQPISMSSLCASRHRMFCSRDVSRTLSIRHSSAASTRPPRTPKGGVDWRRRSIA